MIKTIIFDLGDVLIPSADRNILSNASELLGLDESRLKKEIKKHIAEVQIDSISEVEFWNKIIINNNLKEQNKEDLENLFIEPYKKEFKINKELIYLIKLLKRNYKVGCISNTINSHAKFNRKQGALKFFNPCILSNEVRARKPSSKIFEIYLKQANCRPEEGLFITEIDPRLSGAQELGLQTLQFFGVVRLKNDLNDLGLNGL